MRLTPSQGEVARSTKRFRVLVAGRRFGKTVLAVEEMLGFLVRKGDGWNVAYLAPTFGQARDICWLALKKRLAPVTIAANDTRLEITVKTASGGTATVKVRSWDAIDTLRGQAFDFLVLDEVASYKGFWEGWEEVLRPTLSDRVGHALFIGTPKGFNHFYELSNEQEQHPDTWQTFRFTTYDNPTIPKDEIDQAKAQLPEDTFAQEYLADFRKAEGLVYPEFDRQRHVNAEIPFENVARRLVGVDFGYTNPTAALLVLEMRDGRFWVAEEWYKAGRDTEEIVSAIRSMRPESVYPDPAEPDRVELLRRAGLSVREVNKDVQWGIERVRSLIKQGRVLIHPRCVNLLDELSTYRWKDGKSDKNAPDEPEKHNDHACDSLRYCLAMGVDDNPNDFALMARIQQNRARILSGR